MSKGLCQVDLTGQRFGRLSVVRHVKRTRGYDWECVCDCGRVLIVKAGALRRGQTHCSNSAHVNIKHGFSRVGKLRRTEHIIWCGIRSRCYNRNSTIFRHYGGRGITMCDRWRDSFANFFSDMGERPFPRAEIDRIDNNGPYSPENCRWTDRKTQMQNMRANVYLELRGDRLTISEWARRTGIACGVISRRIRQGWPVERALCERPAEKIWANLTIGNETLTIGEWARRVGVATAATIYKRYRAGWDPRSAVFTPGRVTPHPAQEAHL